MGEGTVDTDAHDKSATDSEQNLCLLPCFYVVILISTFRFRRCSAGYGDYSGQLKVVLPPRRIIFIGRNFTFPAMENPLLMTGSD